MSGASDSMMRRLKGRGADPRPFRRAGVRGWVVVAILALVLTAFMPIVSPGSTGFLNRSTPALSLFFFLAAVGWWLRMEHRAFTVAGAFVVLLYAGTAWAPFAYDVQDFTVIALLSSFAVFAMAGFNLVFILEEIVFDLHRELHLAHRMWAFVPSILIAVLVVALPVLNAAGILRAPTVWVACLVWALVYIGWWTFRAFNPIREGPVLRELHLLTAGTIAAAGVVDLTRLIGRDAGVLPSVLMYALMVGTWIYVSYTTLQRTHFLLSANRAVPWLCLLLSASFALLQHASFHYRVEGASGVTNLLEQRVAYLVFGIWVGIAFYVVQGVWRVLRRIRDDRRVDARGRIVAGGLARLAESFMTTERRIGGVAVTLFQGMDRILPGHHRPPARPDLPASWEVDAQGVQRVEEEE